MKCNTEHNFSLIGLMETISLFSKHLLSEWNLNILLFICLVNHCLVFFSCWPHLEMSHTSQKHIRWKNAEQVLIFQTSQLFTSWSNKYTKFIFGKTVCAAGAWHLRAGLLNKIITNAQFFWFDISYHRLIEQFRLERTSEGPCSKQGQVWDQIAKGFILS